MLKILHLMNIQQIIPLKYLLVSIKIFVGVSLEPDAICNESLRIDTFNIASVCPGKLAVYRATG